QSLISITCQLRLAGLPALQAEKNAIGILDRRDVAVVVLDHLDRGAHLLRKKIHVHALREPEGRVRVTEAVSAPTSSRRADLQAGLDKQPFDEGIVEGPRHLSIFGAEHVIVRLGVLAYFSNPFEIGRDIACSDERPKLPFTSDV